MRMLLNLFLILTLCLLFNIRCSEDPDVIISNNITDCFITGRVRPSLPAKVYLIRGMDTIATTKTDGITDGFQFHSIPFGTYVIQVVSDNWYAEEIIDLYNKRIDHFILQMNYGNSNIKCLSNWTKNNISIKEVSKKSKIEFAFSTKKDQASFMENSFTIFPSRLINSYTIDIPYSENFNYQEILLNSDSLFLMSDTLQIIARYKIFDKKLNFKIDSVTFKWGIDSTGFDSIHTEQLIKQVRIGDKAFIFDNYSSHTLNDVNPEDEIEIIFNQFMNWQSVEKSFSLKPQTSAAYFWSGDTFRIFPSNALLADTLYLLTIDTTAMARDSTFFRCPFHIGIKTLKSSFFSNCWPLDGTEIVHTSVPFTFESPFSIEPSMLKSSFTINPPVDSLQFVLEKPGKINVYHAKLLQDTTYQIIINGNFMSRKGTLLGSDYTITFSTIGKQ